ncbi:MAG TPA: SAM-dependent methyltransferase [Mycobacteriales bacterium]|nr:SAM-dependent methyltransferase [Mycobacteriales bacterium]
MREGQASQTARRVAAQRRHFPRVPAEYGDSRADRLLHADVAGDLPFRNTAFAVYLAARTRFFDTAVVTAIADRIAQIVVIGAGYDGRSLRYAAPDVRWFELDHPATIRDKTARLARLGVAGAAACVPADFTTDDVARLLADAGQVAGAPSLFYCEGVTPYLEREVVGGLLRAVRSRAAPGSRLAIDVPLVPRGWRARRARARLRARVRAQGEPMRFAIRFAELGPLLDDCGWSIDRAVGPAGDDPLRSSRSTAFVLASPYP